MGPPPAGYLRSQTGELVPLPVQHAANAPPPPPHDPFGPLDVPPLPPKAAKDPNARLAHTFRADHKVRVWKIAEDGSERAVLVKDYYAAAVQRAGSIEAFLDGVVRPQHGPFAGQPDRVYLIALVAPDGRVGTAKEFVVAGAAVQDDKAASGGGSVQLAPGEAPVTLDTLMRFQAWLEARQPQAQAAPPPASTPVPVTPPRPAGLGTPLDFLLSSAPAPTPAPKMDPTVEIAKTISEAQQATFAQAMQIVQAQQARTPSLAPPRAERDDTALTILMEQLRSEREQNKLFLAKLLDGQRGPDPVLIAKIESLTKEVSDLKSQPDEDEGEDLLRTVNKWKTIHAAISGEAIFGAPPKTGTDRLMDVIGRGLERLPETIAEGRAFLATSAEIQAQHDRKQLSAPTVVAPTPVAAPTPVVAPAPVVPVVTRAPIEPRQPIDPLELQRKRDKVAREKLKASSPEVAAAIGRTFAAESDGEIASGIRDLIGAFAAKAEAEGGDSMTARQLGEVVALFESKDVPNLVRKLQTILGFAGYRSDATPERLQRIVEATLRVNEAGGDEEPDEEEAGA